MRPATRAWLRTALLLLLALPAHADQKPTEDSVVRAMRDELARSVAHLQLPDAGKPYYFSLLLNDNDALFLTASFGAVVNKGQKRARLLRADVRVGDYTVDSSNMGRSGTSMQILPIDDDYDVVRHDAWAAFDDAYKSAAAAYAKKLSMRASFAQNPDEIADFSRESPAQVVVQRNVPKVDAARATALVKELSALARKFPAIQSSELRFVGASGRQVLVSSEDTFASENDAVVSLMFLLRTQAADGMPLVRFESYAAPSLDALPATAALAQSFESAASELTARRAAEIAQDYTGPVLFEGPAAAQLVAYLLAPQFAGTPVSKLEAMRGMGNETELAGKLGQRVLPAGFSVVDDPTLERWGDAPLIGRSAADDEGMPAQRVVLVQDGVLQGFLMSRAPRKGFPHSNGHAHGGSFGPVRAGWNNLIITTDKGIPQPELYKKLLAEAKAAGQSYALIVRSIDDPALSGDMFAIMQRGTSKVPPPTELIKIGLDGKQEPLRGASFGPLPLASLEELVAAGRDSIVSNRVMGYPSSIAAPALLFKRVELRKPPEQQRKLPALPHPFFATQP